MGLAFALDLGTTTISAVAVSPDGTLAGRVVLPNNAGISGLPAGHAEQNLLRIWQIAIEALRRLAAQASGTPHSLGITGQMHGVLLLGSGRQPLTNLITWQDRRANQKMPGAEKTYLEKLLSRCPDDAVHRSGCNLAAGYLGTTLFWLNQERTLPALMASPLRTLLPGMWLEPCWRELRAACTRFMNTRANCGRLISRESSARGMDYGITHCSCARLRESFNGRYWFPLIKKRPPTARPSWRGQTQVSGGIWWLREGRSG